MMEQERTGVTRLGPMWVKEIRDSIQKRRDKIAAMASRCKPDGDYRKQMEMALAEIDMMLAGRDLLAAITALLPMAERAFFGGDDEWQILVTARKAVAKATGAAS